MCTQGLCEERELTDFDGARFYIVLISRRGRLHVGPRYKARGLNDYAEPGNEIECEQVRVCEGGGGMCSKVFSVKEEGGGWVPHNTHVRAHIHVGHLEALASGGCGHALVRHTHLHTHTHTHSHTHTVTHARVHTHEHMRVSDLGLLSLHCYRLDVLTGALRSSGAAPGVRASARCGPAYTHVHTHACTRTCRSSGAAPGVRAWARRGPATHGGAAVCHCGGAWT